MGTTNITVPVPDDRVADFYRWFADWADGRFLPEQHINNDAMRSGSASPSLDLDSATRWWKLLKPSERAVFSLWIDAAPRMLSAGEIVEKLELNGPRDIPGILSWPGRKGTRAGFDVKWDFRRDPATGEAQYGLENLEYADLLGRARAAAEGAR